MRKDKIWTQREYHAAYRSLRRGIDFDWLMTDKNISQYAVKAADYSYQAFGYEMSGWIIASRRKRFHAIKIRVATREEIPF